MDAATISALAALGGAFIGGLTSFATSWLTQQRQAKAQQLAHQLTKREELYRVFIEEASKLHGGGPLVVENREGVFSRYPKKESGSWGESDRGGIRLWGKVYNVSAKWKVFLDLIG